MKQKNSTATKPHATPSTGLARLRDPFLPHQISTLPKPYKKDSPKGKCGECGGWHGLPAVHLDYVGHAALTDRLLDADPAWNWTPVAQEPNGLPHFDASGGLWIYLTVCGVTRLGYGHAEAKSYMDPGAREKEIIGDALRNAAMRFGAALDLWHRGQLHVEEDESQDAPTATVTTGPTPVVRKATATKPSSGPVISDAQRKRLFAIATKAGRNQEVLKVWLAARWGYESSQAIGRNDYETIIAAIEAPGPLDLGATTEVESQDHDADIDDRPDEGE